MRITHRHPSLAPNSALRTTAAPPTMGGHQRTCRPVDGVSQKLTTPICDLGKRSPDTGRRQLLRDRPRLPAPMRTYALWTTPHTPIIGPHPRIVRIDETAPPTQIPPGQTRQRCRFVHNRYSVRRRWGPLAEQRRRPPRLPAPLRNPPCGLPHCGQPRPHQQWVDTHQRKSKLPARRGRSYSNGQSSLSSKSRTHPLKGSMKPRPVHLSSIGTAKSSSSAGNSVG